MHNILGNGVDAAHRDTLQVCARAVLVFIFAVAMVRVAKRRFLSDMTAFDVILGIMLGSILSRTINGPSPLVPTLVASFLLMLLHRGLSGLSHRFKWFSVLVKGRSVTLFDEGGRASAALRRHHISEEDLHQGSRTEGGISDLGQARTVTMERQAERGARTGRLRRPHGPVGHDARRSLRVPR